MRVLHEQRYREWLGGTVNTTLCGRLASGDDMNVAEKASEVTCKLCLRRRRQIDAQKSTHQGLTPNAR